MSERYKISSIEDFIGSLAIPSETISLNEMIGALIAEEEAFSTAEVTVNPAFKKSHLAKGFLKSISVGRQFETESLDEMPESEIEQAMINRRMGRTDFLDNPEEAAMEFLLREEVKNALGSLPLRKRHIVEMRFGLNHERKCTFQELGQFFDRTPQNMRQIVNNAIEILRQSKTLEETFWEYYGAENKDAHKAKEALKNGIVNAIYQKDFERAQQNIKKIEYQKLYLETLSSQEREIIEEIKQYPFSYRWSKETIDHFIAWSSRIWSDSQKRDFPIRADVLAGVIMELKEVWRLKAQIPVKPMV